MFELIDFLIVRPITNILFVIYSVVGDFGLAIILFTVLVKICMWPLVKRQLHQTKLMRKIQPELAKIKENCKGNRQMESLQMMDLYRRYNVKPFASFLTILIQLPIYIALFTAIRVVVTPTPADNLERRAYPAVQQLPKVNEIIELQKPYLEDANNSYDYKPMLFGVVDLSARPGFSTPSQVVIFIFAILAAFVQWYMTKQQMPSGKSEKKKSFRELIKESENGKEPSQADLNAMVSKQTSTMMPFMMLLIMINLPGALVFYYLLSNTITVFQQKVVLKRTTEEMEISADKAVLKKLKSAREAEVIENKKTGTRITRISAKDLKKSEGSKSSGNSKSSTSKKSDTSDRRKGGKKVNKKEQ